MTVRRATAARARGRAGGPSPVRSLPTSEWVPRAVSVAVLISPSPLSSSEAAAAVRPDTVRPPSWEHPSPAAAGTAGRTVFHMGDSDRRRPAGLRRGSAAPARVPAFAAAAKRRGVRANAITQVIAGSTGSFSRGVCAILGLPIRRSKHGSRARRRVHHRLPGQQVHRADRPGDPGSRGAARSACSICCS